MSQKDDGYSFMLHGGGLIHTFHLYILLLFLLDTCNK